MQAALPMYSGQEDTAREELKSFPTNQTYTSSQYPTETQNTSSYAPGGTVPRDTPSNFVEPATTEAQLISFD
ncbi:unnamed protein product [Trichobilharzia regenti]|nr:unnamed protein product [Trichobilharzia regenti]